MQWYMQNAELWIIEHSLCSLLADSNSTFHAVEPARVNSNLILPPFGAIPFVDSAADD
jgi:hypothetical protein